jgi:gliding motility-associated protein GldM
MAKAKETPRQKMIGMMYLVLTALLALNVSTSVLDAFSIIDEGLNKTAKTIQDKSEEIYKDFAKQFAINEAKVSNWRNLALEVKKEADSLYKHIQDLKIEVVIEARDEEAIEGDIIHRNKIKSVTDYDTPKRVMIGSEYKEDCKATKLKNMIADYRNFLLTLVKEENVQLRSSIINSLNTDDPEPENVKGKSREKLKWEEHKFGHSPLVGFLAIMSSLQIDIKNAEAEVIKYLFAQIEAGAVKFNEIEAVVVHNSNYIIKGNEYQAKIFLAARDTTQPPKVWIAQGDQPYAIVRDSLGNIKYERKEGLDYQSLPVEGGKGVYRIKGTSMGYRKWGGIIEIPGPGGDPIRRPFTETFQVAEGNVVVSPTKMNLFYLGVDNPVDISVAGVAPDKVYANMTNGTITRSRGGSWIVRPRRPGNSYVIVSAEIDGAKREVDRKEFRVKTVPTPQAMVNNQTGGAINKNILLAQTGVAAVMENFEFDLTFTVTEFKVLTIVQGFVRDASSESNRFTQKQKDIIRGLSKGSPLYIQDIKAVGPDGSVRNLQTINFRIN